jgi:hypothetical protein
MIETKWAQTGQKPESVRVINIEDLQALYEFSGFI